MRLPPSISILGTRGIPASHGGFETFAERFALHMSAQGWKVTVYCQSEGARAVPVVDDWHGIRRVTIASDGGAVGTVAFDWRCVCHAMQTKGVLLVLGYNTALFSALLRFSGNPVLTNMDGIEWRRAKWSWPARAWLYLNEWIGALTSTKLIADHPEIARHLQRRRSAKDIVMIPYGADEVAFAPEEPVRALGLGPGNYLLSIGRMEPENNILPMVLAFAERSRQLKMICLGKLEPEKNPYHAAVLAAGQGRVVFPGAIYDASTIKALRFHAAAYCHGHSVGGTNPSLVEALGAGNAVIGHDNPYNRWVAGPGQFYFKDQAACSQVFDMIESEPEAVRYAREAARERFKSLGWEDILQRYEALCLGSLEGR